MGDSDTEWMTADQVLELVKPGDIVEIDIGHVPHFVFNIKRGWCVQVTPLADSFSADYVVKDATDLHQEAGSHLCRINNLEKIAEEKHLTQRSLKDALQVAREGLAHGPVRLPVHNIVPIDGFKNIAQEFCMHWKFLPQMSDDDQFSNLVING
jgi:hypothetical protein